MTTLPQSHIEDAHKLTADGRVELFELTPAPPATGNLYFKADSPVTWDEKDYFGIPLQLSGLKYSSTAGSPTPRLIIGNENINLGPFKPLIAQGTLDGAIIVYRTVLLEDLLADNNDSSFQVFRVKRIEGYSRSVITLALATFSAAQSQRMPFRQFVPPAFPYVTR